MSQPPPYLISDSGYTGACWEAEQRNLKPSEWVYVPWDGNRFWRLAGRRGYKNYPERLIGWFRDEERERLYRE